MGKIKFDKYLNKYITYLSNYPTKRFTISIILIFTVIVILDSEIVKFAAYTGIQFPTSLNEYIFFTFSLLFSIISIVLMTLVIKTIAANHVLPRLRFFNWFILSSQILASSIILILVLHMIFFSMYSINLIRIETYLNYGTTFVFLVLLVIIFLRWIRIRKNLVVFLFGISFSFLSINILVSIAYLDSYFSNAVKLDIKPYPITSFITNFGGSIERQQLVFVSDLLSVFAFSSLWIATIILLNQYRLKIGQIRYYLIIILPIIYYIFPFEAYFGNIFFSLILDSPANFGITYIMIFSATKQIGALFFSLFFLIVSSLVAKSKYQRTILISAIGMAIVFGSQEIASLQYSVYPPFGLITQAFMPLGAYLLFIGILVSAQNISRNVELRKEVYKHATNKMDLLKSIGLAEMENQLLNKYRNITKLHNIKKTYNIELEQDEIKEIISDVMKELSAFKKDKI